MIELKPQKLFGKNVGKIKKTQQMCQAAPRSIFPSSNCADAKAGKPSCDSSSFSLVLESERCSMIAS